MNNNILQKLGARLNLAWFRKVPQILQTEASECGLASLAMVAHYYGLNIDLFNLRQHFNISARGATLNTVIEIARHLNLKTRALSLDLDELGELRRPCILHWDMNHFVVLVAIRRGRVIIHDPAFGRRVLGIREVSQHFTGVALEAWPNSDFKPVSLQSRLQLRSLLRNVAGLKAALTKIFCLSLVVEAINLILPVGTQLVMDHVILAGDNNLLALICIGLLAFILFRTFISMLRSWTTLVMSSLLTVQWNAGLFDHLMKLPLAWFEKRKLGDIQSRFISLDTIRNTFTTGIVSSILDGIMVVGVLIMMWLYGGWLVWLVLAFTLMYLALRLVTWRFYRQMTEERIVKDAKADSHFMETLYGVGTLKALGLQDTRAQHWLNLKIDSTNTNIRITKLDMMFGGINALINTFDQVVILWIGALMVIDNHMTVGMFVAFNAYRGQFSDRAGNLINKLLELRMLGLHSERVADIVLSDPEKELPYHRIHNPGEPATLSVNNVTYCYDPMSPPVLHNVNLEVEAGESIAIVGPSGAGKTTLMKVMTGLLEPMKGAILINGIEIQQLGLNNYRQAIACVLQEDRLFAGSIAENICSFDPAPDFELIQACAEHCNIHQDIMQMPMTYETLIGEFGGRLSGGQKQRILIARALYRQPSILFMDEATSHLDQDNEAHINRAISQLKITRIIIAHRPSTIASADRVITIGSEQPELAIPNL